MPTTTTFKGVRSVNDSLLSDQLETNLVSYFDWATLGIGGFSNVNIPTSGAFGGNQHQLAVVNDPRYIQGQVWQGFRKNWVHESGVENSAQPVSISGVYVNSSFIPLNSGYYVNYPDGRVIFDVPVALNSTVAIEYSYKHVDYNSAGVPWFKELQQNSYRVDDYHFRLRGSGTWNVFPENRVQLPAVIVEVTPGRTMRGSELGGGQIIKQDVSFHIFAETPFDKNQLIDIISYQRDKTILLYDKNVVRNSGQFPLDYRGSIVNLNSNYINLTRHSTEGGFQWKKCTFFNMSVQPKSLAAPIYGAVVRSVCEVYMPEI